MFKDRQQAGRILARRVAEDLARLPQTKALDQIVIGLPRGGVPVAREIALPLNAPLIVLASKKIGAPYQPEFAIGAVSSAGVVVLNQHIDYFIDEHRAYIEERVKELTKETRFLERGWMQAAGINMPDLRGKRVIVVDDGVATGMTTEAALLSVKKLGAAQIILAAPIIAEEAKERLAKECDLVVAVLLPQHFCGIGEFYEDFHQVSDLEVINVLKEVAFSQRRESQPQVS